jgi:hypothetical protein
MVIAPPTICLPILSVYYVQFITISMAIYTIAM